MIATTQQSVTRDLDMGSSGRPPRNWKGICIALMVIILVLSLVIVSILLLSPEESKQQVGSRLTLEDLGKLEYQLHDPKVRWVSDRELVLNTREGYVIRLDVASREQETLVENSTLVPMRAASMEIAPDLQHLLLAHDRQPVYRSSFTASYAVYNIGTREISELNPPEMNHSTLQYAAWGPQGSQLVFIYENNIYYQQDGSGQAVSLTSSGRPGSVANGITDWLYEEEILQTYPAHWWSPDGARLAYITLNNSLVPNMELPQFLGSVYPSSKRYPYPKAGQQIPLVKLSVVNLYGPAHTLVLLPPDTFRYREYFITMVKWFANTRLAVRWLNRPQNCSILTFCEATTGACQEKHKVTSDLWVSRQQEQPVFSKDGESLFLSLPVKQGARGEFHHLAMLATQTLGKENNIRFLTSGNWEVTRIVAYEEESNNVFFLSTEDSPRRRHLYSVDSTGSFNRVCVTCSIFPDCAFVDVEFSPERGHFLLYCKGPGIPQVSVHKTRDPSDFLILEDNHMLREELRAKEMPIYEYKTIRLAGYDLPIQLTLPAGYKDSVHPVLLLLDEAPGGQQVKEEFQLGWDSILVSSSRAILVRFDGRGSGRQGLRLLHEISRKLGTMEVKDHIALTEWLSQLPYVDRQRIGVYGKAYGGFLTLKLLAATDILFKCGVAVAPITNFRLHASAFSERYLGVPTREDAAYTVASLWDDAPRLKDQHFLLVHGTGDANVHFQHTAELINHLILADANVTSKVYPDEGHFFRQENKQHLQKTIVSYFQDCFQVSRKKPSPRHEEEYS
ncbi:inactive dipeptidyl peptidase 10-like [Ambystoma mexicanum]|uniref:inactive dipeptidyl peptidase 10-like n=1 Tax=Ambystoma mexicanum TaxID=8296 RepID=UPI0037E6FC41